MSSRTALTHIISTEDGTSSAVWGPFLLKSAFQPIFAFHGGKLSIAAFEGLIRPFRAEKAVPPGIFFGALPAMDRLQVETLTRTLHLINASVCLPSNTALFVNFDPSVFIDRSISDTALQDMRNVLVEHSIDRNRIVCEVTEQKSGSQDALHTFVSSLRNNGFKIAVDDYGSEESDIARIKELRPDIVKFDAHWITRLMESGPGFGLLSAMVEIFEKQNIKTVFEGLEEDWQLELAERCGASMVQGYVLARPQIAPGEFGAFRKIAPEEKQTLVSPVSAAQPAAVRDPSTFRRPFKTFGRKIAS